MRIKLITAIGTLTLGAMSLFAQTPQFFTGSVTDSMCGAKHMMKNTSAAEYTRNASTKAQIMLLPAETRSIRSRATRLCSKSWPARKSRSKEKQKATPSSWIRSLQVNPELM